MQRHLASLLYLYKPELSVNPVCIVYEGKRTVHCCTGIPNITQIGIQLMHHREIQPQIPFHVVV